MSTTPKSTSKGKESRADIDELERKSVKSVNDKKEKIIKLIDDILEEDDKLFARACLDKLNRMVINELNSSQTSGIMPQSFSTPIKFNQDNYKLNFHCTTYHWISDCRPKSRIQIKSETSHNFLFKLVNGKPYLGVSEIDTEWYELSLNDIIIGFKDEFGADTKMKVKLVKMASPVVI